jgi:hypothetical protein
MLLLFIDAVYSFLVTRFARLCKLPAPCPFCSRLDHVLGKEQLRFYREADMQNSQVGDSILGILPPPPKACRCPNYV